MKILRDIPRRSFGILLPLILAASAGAQGTPAGASGARIAGRVLDARTASPISDAGVQLVGTAAGVTTDADGRFVLKGVTPGTVTLHVRRLGYQPKTITGILVAPGAMVEQAIVLDPATVRLSATVVNAASDKGSVNAALERQRAAAGIVNAVTAEQISRSGDANAAQAVQRVSGVTIQDNKYVFVRGLGERYTVTSLNGARIPSPEPERKVVPLDLFPSGLLQAVTTTKTFTPDQSGDFAGAAVDIRTKEYPSHRTSSYSWSTAMTPGVTGRGTIAAPATGSEWLGFAGDARGLPSAVAAYGDRLGGLSGAQLNQVVRSFRPVWSPVERRPAPNMSTALSTGGTAGFLGRRVGYLLSGSYGLSSEAQRNEVRALAVPSTTGAGPQQPFNRFVGETGRSSVLWGGLANFSSLVLPRTLVSLENMYSHTADNEARADTGFLQQGGIDAPARRTTLRFVQRAVRSSQLRVEQGLGSGSDLTVAVTASGVTRDEPDRADFVQFRPEDQRAGGWLPYQWLASDNDGARRSFSSLRETGWNYAVDYQQRVGAFADPARIKAGLALRDTRRDVDNRTYSIFGRNLTREQLQLSPEELFDGRFASDTAAHLVPSNNSTTGAYRAVDRVAAGYLMAELPLGRSLRLVAGARAEQWGLRIDQALLFTGDAPSPAHRTLDVLPSLALNVALGTSQNLRLSAARTLSRPEYREVSTTMFCDAIGERCTIGNANLQRALIDNYDLRWEIYPGRGELLSAALFAKRFHDPIERIEIGTSGASSYGFVNTDGASNVGVEVELRTTLGRLADVLTPFGTFVNATVMRSAIDVGNDSISALTSTRRAMTGQAPYVVNAGLTWSPRPAVSATALYNVVGRRIVAVGSKPVADTYELPRQGLDLSLQFPVGRALSAKLNARNLLAIPVRQASGGVTRLSYDTGRVLQMGLTWSRD